MSALQIGKRTSYHDIKRKYFGHTMRNSEMYGLLQLVIEGKVLIEENQEKDESPGSIT